LGRFDDAEKTLLQGVSEAPNWSELWMELGYMLFGSNNKNLCISYCMQAANRINTPTQLWRENNKYEDQPRRLMSFCYQELGDTQRAYDMAIEAKRFIGDNDVEWNNRIEALRVILSSSEVRQDTRQKIALVRPGAIGDILMICNVIPELRAKYPNAVIDFFTKTSGLEEILTKAGIDHIYDCDVLGPIEYTYDTVKYLVGYPLPPKENYPNAPMSKHLLEYFQDEINEI